MRKFRKKRTGSLFKRYFIQITATVLFCLTITSFTVLLLSVNFWKTDRLALLKDDALSLVQSVNSVLSGVSLPFEDINVKEKHLVKQLITAVAKSAVSEIYFVGRDGHILMCCDSKINEDGDEILDVVCQAHKEYIFSQDMLDKFDASPNKCFEYKGKLDASSSEDYFVVAIPFLFGGENCFLVVMQAESVAYLPYTTIFLRILISVGIIAVLISFAISFSLSLRMTKPLKRITEATNHYADGDFSVRINASEIYNELSELVEAVNKMADSLAGLEESRSSFVANVSHELKTPMTTISGFIDGILDGTVSEEDTKKYLTIVSDEVKRLSRLVVAMLNMSKIEAGKLALNRTAFNLREMLLKTLLGFEKLIKEKEITVLNYTSPEPAVIFADEPLINQVIYNLLDNAVKFTPRAGTVTLALKNEKKNIIFSVRNTGRGVPAEEYNLIFDRFYKLDKSRGLDAKSFGMGLYIVRSIIELHKGTIDINSEPDSFTEFIIRLPIQ